jgi:uncharacterized protein YndB with AHSA1/START domain
VSDRSAEHATIVLERLYEAPPERAFGAWADAAAKRRWFAGTDDDHELDFRVGGRESSSGRAPDGGEYAYEAIYRDIVPGERIVYTYELAIGGEPFSVSLVTVELAAADGGTRLLLTEQTVFLDRRDEAARREHGWGGLLDALGGELA